MKANLIKKLSKIKGKINISGTSLLVLALVAVMLLAPVLANLPQLEIEKTEVEATALSAHCTDGIYNEGEEGLDCGWTCPNDCNFIEKSGILTGDEVWEGNILIPKSVTVPQGVTLTIRPGTVIKFKYSQDYKNPDRAMLTVDGGTLKAIGTPEKQIWFTSASPNPINGDWTAIQIRRSNDSEIRYAIVEFSQLGIFLWESDATITNSIIRWTNTEGIYMEQSTATIENNLFYGVGYNAIAMEQFNYDVHIKNNKFINGHEAIHGEATEAIIEGNLISNNWWGITFTHKSNVIIRNNKIEANSKQAVLLQNNTSVPLMELNEVYNNNQGIFCMSGCSLTAHNNAFYDNNNRDMILDYYDYVDITNNWWGTTDEEEIRSRIDSDPLANFKPYLSSNPVDFQPPALDFNDNKNFVISYIPGDPQDQFAYIYPEEDETRKMLKKIGEGVGFGFSLVWADGYLWRSSVKISGILEVDPGSGNVVDHFEVPGLLNPRGLAYDGIHFWINDYTSKKIFQVDKEGNLISTFDTPEELGDTSSIVWDGEYLYLKSWMEAKLCKIDEEGNILETLNLGAPVSTSITFDGQYFWTKVGCRICKFTKDGTLVGEIYPVAHRNMALAWQPADNAHGGYLWTLDATCEIWDDPKISQVEILDDSLKPTEGCSFDSFFVECTSYQINNNNFVINIRNTGPPLTINQITQCFLGEVGAEGPDCPPLSNLNLQINRGEEAEIVVPCPILNNYVGETVDMRIQIIGYDRTGEKIIEGELIDTVGGGLSLPYPYNPTDTEVANALDYLRSQQTTDGDIGGFGPSAWVTMAIATAGEDPHDWKVGSNPSIVDYLVANIASATSATDYARMILAIVVADEDPTSFGGRDFVNLLKGQYNGGQIGDASLVNDDFWGVIALISAGESRSSEIIQDSLSFIKSCQQSDGGWGFDVSASWGTDVDSTGAAIMALVAAGESPSSTAIANGLDYIKSNQADSGGFLSWGATNADTDSWAINAIVAAGQDPTSNDWTKNNNTPVDDLLSFQQGNGQFYWQSDDPGAWPCQTTACAIQALLGKPYPVKVLQHNDILAFYRTLGDDPIKVETGDLLEAINDWAKGVILPGFNRAITTMELLQLIGEWAAG